MRMSIDSSRALQPAQIPACHRTGGHQSRSRREPIVNLILALAVAAINDRPQRSHDAPLLGQSAGRFEIERVFPTSEDETPLRHTKSLGSEGDRGTRVITTLLLVRRPGGRARETPFGPSMSESGLSGQATVATQPDKRGQSSWQSRPGLRFVAIPD